MSRRFLKQYFCPLTRNECRTDCMFCYIENEIDDNGVSESVRCAICLIAENISPGDFEDWEDYA